MIPLFLVPLPRGASLPGYAPAEGGLAVKAGAWLATWLVSSLPLWLVLIACSKKNPKPKIMYSDIRGYISAALRVLFSIFPVTHKEEVYQEFHA